jgi:hypothetical protein
MVAASSAKGLVNMRLWFSRENSLYREDCEGISVVVQGEMVCGGKGQQRDARHSGPRSVGLTGFSVRATWEI